MNIDIFTLGLSFILLHELDAMRCHEWRIFPLTSFLPDRTGMMVFIFLHIPLFYWILLPKTINNLSFRYGFSIFLIVHFLLHVGFLWHRKNEFKDWISWTLIIGAAICGLFYLLIK